jgi:hypothetical protein
MIYPKQQKPPTLWNIIYPTILAYNANFFSLTNLAVQYSTWLFITNLVFFLGCTIAIIGSFATFILYTSGGGQTGQFLGIIVLIVVLTLFHLYNFASSKSEFSKMLISLTAYQLLTGNVKGLQTSQPRSKPSLSKLCKLDFSIDTLIIIAATAEELSVWPALLIIMLQIYNASQYFISDIIIIAENCDDFTALQRSRNISKSHSLKINMISGITWLTLIPFNLLAFTPAIIVWKIEWQTLKLSLLSWDPISHLLQASVLSILLFAMVQILTFPLWQLVKASLYRELNLLEN